MMDIAEQERKASFRHRLNGFMAGVASGITKLIVGHPFDTIKVRLQTSGVSEGRFKGPLHCLVTTVRKEGFFAVYKGATPPLVGWMFMDSLMLGSLHNYRLLLQGGDPTHKLSIFEHGLAGLGAGCTVSFIAAPIEQVKARLQVQYDASTKQYNGPIDCARQLIRNNGIKGLWKGLSATLLFRSWFFVYWSSYEVMVRGMRSHTQFSEPLINFLAGGMAANFFWLGSFPADVVKNRIMTQPDTRPLRYPSIVACAREVKRMEGFRGFYRGFLPCILRAFPTNASAILMFESVMRLLKEY
ncbi:uncharacterized protein VTP21DRAFT_9130 [Calcarisporiella thermophila]|uniref:uncharacterized protein n=1 Tax=Calcarisporiella thermophila TaxID=911321 RepID=UPI0037448D04